MLGPDQDVPLLVQMVRDHRQVPPGPGEVGTQDDAKDCDGTLRGPPRERRDSAGALWVQDEEVPNQRGAWIDLVEMEDSDGALQDPGEVQQGERGTLKEEKCAGAQLDLGQRQQGRVLNCKAEVLQNGQAVHLGCGERGEGYDGAPVDSQEMLEDYAAARGPPGMVVPEHNGSL